MLLSFFSSLLSYQKDVIGKKKDTKTLSTARLDLGDYVNEDGSEPILLQLKLKRLKETCSLVLSIQTQWVKLNNQLIKQKVEGLTGQTQGSSKNIISTFAGDFEVETDPEGLTETSMGTTSGSDDELYMDEEDIFVANDDYEDEKERNIPEVSKGEEVNYRRKVELLEQECYERGKTIRSLEEQLHSAKKTLKSLQKAQGGQQWSISTKGKQDKPGPSAEIETETSKDIVQTLQRRIQILEFVECNIYQAKKLVLSKDGMPVVGEYMFIWMVNNHILDDSPNGSSVIAAGDEKSTISKVLNAIHACAKRAKVHEKGYWLSVACYFLHMLHKDSLSGSLAQFLKESVMTLITSIINNLLCDVYHDLDPVLIPAILEQPSSFLQQEEKSDEETESSTEMKVVPKLEEYFRVFKDNNVPNQLMQQFFAHLLRFIDYTLCNSLFAQKHLCTCANGFQIKLELSKVEQWISKTLGDLRLVSV
ncbi:hypothetical protein QOT17_022293 [Balamuthia mandrillaris]